MIDLFHHRAMLRQIQQMKPARNFLRDTFFRNSRVFDTDTVDVDIVKGKRRIAPYVSPYLEGKKVERIGYQTNTIKPGYVKPKTETNVAHLLKRVPGVTVYEGNMTPAQRAAMQLGEDLRELNDMIDRTEEFQCAEALNTGVVTISGEGMNFTVDFLMDASHKITLAGANLWSDSASDPLKNLRTWRRKIIQDSGLNPDTIVMAANVVDVFLEHDRIKNTLDNRRIDRGFINPQLLPDGVTYLGYMPEIGCDIYAYDEWYIDPVSEIETAMVPDNKVWMGASRAQNTKLYGLIQDLKLGSFAVTRFPKSWEQEDPSVRWLLLQSAPLMALNQPDAFISADVL